MALLLTAALLNPIHAHTVAELKEWETAWLEKAVTALDEELMATWRQMHDHHPWYYAPDEPAISTAARVERPNSGMGGDVEQWRSKVSIYFPPDQVDRALRVMACESGGNPNAYNRSGATGLMQVLASWADNFGYQPSNLFDPDINLHVASLLWADGGWAHWVCK